MSHRKAVIRLSLVCLFAVISTMSEPAMAQNTYDNGSVTVYSLEGSPPSSLSTTQPVAPPIQTFSLDAPAPDIKSMPIAEAKPVPAPIPQTTQQINNALVGNISTDYAPGSLIIVGRAATVVPISTANPVYSPAENLLRELKANLPEK